MTMPFKRPFLTVDIIIEIDGGIVLIERRNPPLGWALPGGFVDYGETLENAAKREAKEETALSVHLMEQFHTYSEPSRDPRHHTVSTVFIARANGKPKGGDDAAKAVIVDPAKPPSPLVFDHATIIEDYCKHHQGMSKMEIFRQTL